MVGVILMHSLIQGLHLARKQRGPSWPSWRYGPKGQAEIFQTEKDVPIGWTKKAGEIYIPPPPPEKLDKEQLIKDLEAQGVEVLGWWSAAKMKEVLG